MSGQPRQGYYIDGKRIPAVTTIIGNCKIGGIEPLLSWANRMGQEGKNHRDEANKAADAGTAAHDMIEAYIRGTEFDPEPYTYEALDTAKPCFDGFRKWADQSQLRLVQSEVSLVSNQYRYGGTMDALAMGDDLILGDWKTASGVYPDNLIQLAAYKQLWEENNPDRPITGGMYLLRISKQREEGDPVTFAHHYWEHLDMAWDAFVHMRELYDLQKRIKGLC